MSVKCTCGTKFTGGICSDWCDSLKPTEDIATQDFMDVLEPDDTSPIPRALKRTPYIYQGNGVWVPTTSAPVTPVKRNPLSPDKVNPFKQNNLTNRANHMKDHPDTWQDEMKTAGLDHPWQLAVK